MSRINRRASSSPLTFGFSGDRREYMGNIAVLIEGGKRGGGYYGNGEQGKMARAIETVGLYANFDMESSRIDSTRDRFLFADAVLSPVIETVCQSAYHNGNRCPKCDGI